MGINQVLNTAASGLRATQAGLTMIAANVANAQTPGYVRKTLDLVATTAEGSGSSVRAAGVNRVLDEYLQKQLRTEIAGGAYANLRTTFYQRLQQIYGDPNAPGSIESVFNTFTNAVQALVTTPDSSSARSGVISNAEILAQTLNGLSADVQLLRADAESGIADAVVIVNDALEKISVLNRQLSGLTSMSASDAALADQRDSLIEQLSEFMDVRIVPGDQGVINLFTNSGMQLVGSSASQLSFNAHGTVTPQTQWDPDPAKSTLGTLTLVAPNGSTIDLISDRAIRSGKIAAYLEMRDNILVEAQHQLDGFAAAMAQALSDETVAGSAVSAPPQNGFEVDLAGLLNGNRINLTYTDLSGPTQHRVSIVRVDDPAALPLSNDATVDPNDEVIGVDFSGGVAGVVAQLNAALGGLLTFSNPGGTMLSVLDDGAANQSDVNALSVTRTVTGFTNGSASLPMFTDGGTPFTGAISSVGMQWTGIAGRIAVNAQLKADPRKLVLFDTNTDIGDSTRPNFILDRLTSGSYLYSPDTGLGSATSPHAGSLSNFMQQMLSLQGGAAANAKSLSEGQNVVVNALKQRVTEASGVNVDQEMANLIQLQTSYGANARVLSTVKEMLDEILRII